MLNENENHKFNNTKDKRVREERSNTRYLGGSANCVYVHTSKLTELEDFIKQTSKTLTTLTFDFQGVNRLLQ